MTGRQGPNLLARLPKHLRISFGALALMLLPVAVHGSGAAGTVVAMIAHAGETASAEAVGAFNMIDAELALAEPVYRGTDRGDAILILAFAFSGLAAFNLLLFRHLHRVYAPLCGPAGLKG
jgi:hypothetical protein